MKQYVSLSVNVRKLRTELKITNRFFIANFLFLFEYLEILAVYCLLAEFMPSFINHQRVKDHNSGQRLRNSVNLIISPQ